MYHRLSAHLLELTSDTKYAQAADLSAQFIQAHLYNGTIVHDIISLYDCSTSDLAVTYDSGYFIEGLGVYVNVTSNSTWATS